MDEKTLLKRIEDYANANGIVGATVTSRGVGNSRLYATLKNGGSCTLKVANELIAFMAKDDAPLKEAS